MLHLIHLASATTIDLLATHQIQLKHQLQEGSKVVLNGSNRACMRCSEAHIYASGEVQLEAVTTRDQVMQQALPNRIT